MFLPETIGHYLQLIINDGCHVLHAANSVRRVALLL